MFPSVGKLVSTKQICVRILRILKTFPGHVYSVKERFLFFILDPEEFLLTLLQQVLKTEPFLKIK